MDCEKLPSTAHNEIINFYMNLDKDDQNQYT